MYVIFFFRRKILIGYSLGLLAVICHETKTRCLESTSEDETAAARVMMCDYVLEEKDGIPAWIYKTFMKY